MQADILLCGMEKFRHLRLREPDGLVFDPDFDVEFPTLRLVNDYLVLVGSGRNIFLHFWLLLHKKRTVPHCAETILNTTFSGARGNIQRFRMSGQSVPLV